MKSSCSISIPPNWLHNPVKSTHLHTITFSQYSVQTVKNVELYCHNFLRNFRQINFLKNFNLNIMNWFDERNLRDSNFLFFHTDQSTITFFASNRMFLLKKLFENWFDGIFWSWSRFIVIFHILYCVVEIAQIAVHAACYFHDFFQKSMDCSFTENVCTKQNM